MRGWASIQRRRTWISWRIVHGSQIVMKCLYLARVGRPDILSSVDKLAHTLTKWTKACDKRLPRLISFIRHTCEYRQYCYVGSQPPQCRLGLFQDSNFAGDLEDSKSTSPGILCIFGSHTFLPTNWMCQKLTSVSHSSTYAEVISLDAGLGFRDWSISFLTEPNQQNQRCKRVTVKLVGKHSTKHANTNTKHEHQSRSDQYWSRSIKRNTSWFQCYVVCLLRIMKPWLIW